MPVDDSIAMRTDCIESINIDQVIIRIGAMASQLEAYETFTSHLGVGTIKFSQLPNSMHVKMRWNESDLAPIELYVVRKPKDNATPPILLAVLRKFLAPVLE